MHRASVLIALCLAAPALAEGEAPAAQPAAPAPTQAAAPAPTPAAAPPQPKPAAPTAAAPASEPAPTAAKPPAAPAPAAAKPAPAAGATPEEQTARIDPLKAAADAQRAAQAAASANPGAPVHIQPGALPLPNVPGFAQDDEKVVLMRARYVFGSLLVGDPHPLVEGSTFPFMLEDRRVGSAEELYQEWQRQLRTKRPDLLTLYGIEVLSPADMEKKYGKPPARLANFPYKGPGRTLIAVANFSGHPAIAVFREVAAHDWRVAGYTD